MYMWVHHSATAVYTINEPIGGATQFWLQNNVPIQIRLLHTVKVYGGVAVQFTYIDYYTVLRI